MKQKETLKQALREVLTEMNVTPRAEAAWVGTREAARLASVHVATIHRWLQAGHFGAYAKRIGGRWSISSAAPQLRNQC